MKLSTLLTTTALLTSTLANPVPNISPRFTVTDGDGSSAGTSDYNILAFALTLEHLEAAFYAGAVARFSPSDFTSFGIPDLYPDVLRLARDEATHVDVLTTTLRSLRQPAPSACQYTFPYTDAAGFIALAAVIEGVGVSAYSGDSTSIRNPNVLQVAAGILSVEARHDAILRAASGVAPYAAPFDTPLDFNQVWSLASQFIVPGSCPDDYSGLSLSTFPTLAIVKKDGDGPLKAGSTILLQAGANLSANASEKKRSNMPLHRRHCGATGHVHEHEREHERRDTDVHAAFLTVQGAILMGTVQEGSEFTTTIPDGVAGQVYVILVRGGDDVTDRNTLAGPAILEVPDVLAGDVVERC